MSRLKRYAHSLASGYVALAANVVFTLASVPLALGYLSKAEFGLWGLCTQITGYVALIDFGMAGVSRILIDYKDSKEQGIYGGVIQTLVLVSLVQAVIIIMVGVVLAFLLPTLLEVPSDLQREFQVLLLGQSGFLAGSFLTRLFSFLLAAHQRYDVINYSQVVSFAGNFGGLWWGFSAHYGVLSVLWGHAIGWLLAAAACLRWSLRLGLFPGAGHWGHPSWGRFRELFVYGRDVFLFFLGAQLVTASQTILLTRLMGLEVAGVWSVCLRPFTLLTQIIYRIYDYSCPALAEMMVRGERSQLLRRFRSIAMLSGSLSVGAAILFAACNQDFVHVWSRGKMGWGALNDVLLALWLLMGVWTHCHVGLVGQVKDFRLLRYLYFLEGVFFVGVSLMVLRPGGIPAMLLVSILASALFTFPYGLYRTTEYFAVSWTEVAWKWAWPAIRFGLVFAPLEALIYWLAASFAPVIRLLLCGVLAGGIGALLWFRLGLPSDLKEDLISASPRAIRPLIAGLCGEAVPAPTN